MVEIPGRQFTRREKLNRLVDRSLPAEYWERIRKMTKDQKYAELKEYLWAVGGLNVDIDKLEADRRMMNLPEDRLDQAVAICWKLSGDILTTVPMSVDELKEHMPSSCFATRLKQRYEYLRNAQAAIPPFSLRKGGKVNLAGRDIPIPDEYKLPEREWVPPGPPRPDEGK